MKFDFFVENILAKFKPTEGQTVAIYPGGFKPPHKGHFNALNYILEEADRGIVYIGKGERDGITPQQSKKIWEIYVKHLSKPVDIFIAEKSPIASTIEFADSNPNKNIIVGSGPQDEKHFSYFKNNPEKYPLVKIINIPPMYDRISGTDVRQRICKNTPDAVDCFVPTQTDNNKETDLLSQQEKNAIKRILNL